MTNRVLLVTYAMNRGGAETLIMNLFRHLNRERIVFDFLEHKDESFVSDYDKEIKDLGGRVFSAPRFVKNPVSYYSFVNDFFKSHSEYKIVHGHFMKAAAPAYLNAAKRNGLYTIAHSHNTQDGSKIRNVALGAARYPVRNIADFFMACSVSAGEYAFGKRIVQSKRFSVLHNGIEVTDQKRTQATINDAKRQLGVEGQFVLGNVGRLYPQKNQAFLIDIFANVVNKQPNSHLFIIGEGVLREELERKVALLGLQNKITFTGSISNVGLYYDAMDVFVFPSLFEGLSLSMLEAQSHGMPIVMSSNIPRDNIISERQVTVLEDKIGADNWAKEVLNKQNKYEDYNSANLIKEQGYDIAQVAKNLEEFYLKRINDL